MKRDTNALDQALQSLFEKRGYPGIAVTIRGPEGILFEKGYGYRDVEHQLPAEGGMVHCDGVQAVAYARNRYVGNSDFERTQRQRYVLTQLMAEAKQLSVAQLTEKMQAILEHVTMNIPETEIWSMVTELPEMLDYKFEQVRIPYDDMYDIIYVNGQDMLVPYWEETLQKLQEQIYD